jgi:hypothetical protein
LEKKMRKSPPFKESSGAGAATARPTLAVLALGGLLGLSGCMSTDPKTPEDMPAAKTITVTIKSKPSRFTSTASGRYGTGAATPGNGHTFEFDAPKNGRLSFVSMFGQSNDWFFAPDTQGIALYDAEGVPLTGDVTDQVHLWDAGTEEDQPALQGSNQAPRQSAANTGPADTNPMVRRVPDFPVGKIGNAAAKPGDSLTWEFTPPPGSKISFVSMFGQSNDWFFAPDTSGIELWDDAGNPITADITGRIAIWDAGTEADETPFMGANQGPRQAAPNTGAMDPDNRVRPVSDTGFSGMAGDYIDARLAYLGDGRFRIAIRVLPDSKTPISPLVFQVFTGRHAFFTTGKADNGRGLERLAEDGNPSDLAANIEGYGFGRAQGNIQVTISSLGAGRFSATIMAKGGGVTPVAPGAYSVHTGSSPLFTPGLKAPEGLEAAAEDGNPAGLAAFIAKSTGIPSPLSPLVWVVTDKPEALFAEGSADFGKGLEALAEDGNPAPLAASLKAAGRNAGSVGSAPIKDGGAFTFEVMAKEGETLHFATMFGQSNDVFLGPDGMGIALIEDGDARSGDVTSEVALWDAGTEADQPPGIGADQAPRQSAPNTGAAQGGPVKRIDGTAVYPAAGDLLEVTLSPK